MNIASFILPKSEVVYLRDNMTLRQGLEKLKHTTYTAVPVIDVEDRYVGVVGLGDFLWNILDSNEQLENVTMKHVEHMTLRDVIQHGRVKPVCIDTNMEQLLGQAQVQNFVPVIDDRNVFIGIVTRSDIIKYFVKKQLDAVN